ncbi:SGNH/GDSL hydrolase family protein [Rhizobium leguminosarum]|uniref:SGNH/GDSL hydrolase family protein n=1 Tax=Rhizobium leguminosarum TaxID=384 RepID=UPI0014426C07|nr:SGNH/GDSL hydrolase family protein [Rhizobium leguminosarum]NKL63299.1 hypothetical protein [Rhizobium leguminosarum bv. viciae]
MMVPNLTNTGSGSGTPGNPGRSAELRREGDAIEWRQTGGVWQELVPLDDLKGDQGDAGTGLSNRGAFVPGATYSPSDYVFAPGTTAPISMYISQADEPFVASIDPKDDPTNWVEFSAPAGKDGENGTNGVDGKSLQLQKTSTAIQWRQAPDGAWTDLVLLSALKGTDGTNGTNGTNGSDGKSPELQKSTTAIQWRQGSSGAWADLVPLSAIKGDPGKDADSAYHDGYIDIGQMRMVWGTADTSVVSAKTIAFPAAFAAAPVVQITRIGSATEVVPKSVSKNGFVVGSVSDLGNPVRFGWSAIGLVPTATPAPSTEFDIESLPVWSAAVRAQRAGLRNARILCIGDSTTAGYGALGTAYSNNDQSASYPTQLAAKLTTKGSFASWQNFLGTHNTPNINAFDGRVTTGGGWAGSSGVYGAVLGAWALVSTSTTTKANFRPTTNVDTFEVYSWANSTAANVNITASIDDVDIATISATAYNTSPGALVKTTLKASSVGLHTFNARANASTSAIAICGIIAYDSAVKEVSVLNAGWISGTATDLANGQSLAWSPLNLISAYNPDLILLNMMINDAGASTSKLAYMGSMQQVISAGLASGADVILIKPNRLGNATDANWTLFAGYVDELASKNGLKVIDLTTVLGSYADANAAGWMRDVLHPNTVGYGKIADLIQSVIMP